MTGLTEQQPLAVISAIVIFDWFLSSLWHVYLNFFSKLWMLQEISRKVPEDEEKSKTFVSKGYVSCCLQWEKCKIQFPNANFGYRTFEPCSKTSWACKLQCTLDEFCEMKFRENFRNCEFRFFWVIFWVVGSSQFWGDHRQTSSARFFFIWIGTSSWIVLYWSMLENHRFLSCKRSRMQQSRKSSSGQTAIKSDQGFLFTQDVRPSCMGVSGPF